MKTVLPGQGFRFELDGRSLTIEDVVVFSRRSEYASCALSAEAVEKIMATRALKQDLIGREVPIYGVSTGFGDSAHRQISASKTARLQQNMLRFLGSGTGPIASPEVTRAAMLLRANCLARGNSGVRLELVERLLFYLNNDVLPLIPERGSCGASGDLVPLSYVGAALVGEVEVLHDGEVKDSKELLGELGLEPLLGLELQRDLIHERVRRSGGVGRGGAGPRIRHVHGDGDRKSTRLNSSHTVISYAVFCLKKKKRRRGSALVIQAESRRTLHNKR